MQLSLRAPLLQRILRPCAFRMPPVLDTVFRVYAPHLMAPAIRTIEYALASTSHVHAVEAPAEDVHIWRVSTFKRRRTMMNKHKLKKRRKKLRLNTKISRS